MLTSHIIYFQATDIIIDTTTRSVVTNITIDNVTSAILKNNTSAASLSTSTNQMYIAGGVIYGALWPVIISIGSIGNILTLIVFRTIKYWHNTSQFLVGLALADIITLCILCARMVFTWGQIFWPHQYISWKLSSISFGMPARFFERISKYLIVAIVAERLVAVVWPLRYKHLSSPRRTTAFVVFLFFFLTSMAIPLTVQVFVYDYETRSIGNQFPMVDGEFRDFARARLFNSEMKLVAWFVGRALLVRLGRLAKSLNV